MEKEGSEGGKVKSNKHIAKYKEEIQQRRLEGDSWRIDDAFK